MTPIFTRPARRWVLSWTRTFLSPSMNAYGTIGTNMRLSPNMRVSPNTGMPAVTVPMGLTGAGQGGSSVSVNLELLGRDFAEGVLLALAYDFEQATHYRTAPALYPALG